MLLRKSAPEKTVLSNDKPFYRAFSPRPEERSDFANLAGELLAITNRRLGEPDLTSFCSRGCEQPKVVTRVRIPPSPPHSLSSREISLHYCNNRSKSPQFRKSCSKTGPEKVSRRTLRRDFLAFLSGRRTHSPVSAGNFNSQAEIRSIAVLPLQNLSGDPRQDYFADGMTEELCADLGQISALRVISRTSAMSYRGTKKTLPEIARELGVDAVVEGSVLREGNEVRVTAQLIEARTDQHLWARTYIRDLTSVLALQSEVAKEIADEIRVNVTPQVQARLARSRPVSEK